ncbi:hypothetical protein DNU06_00910 [Putridiphycobacter roseus]|uniref:PAS domain-containing protein n=1 Tax=Putridiphycobacter roseus TaxID=2219161 RepID=A0A2W1NG04_9FLAO|nr:GAF domain-containing protein [Putridiphycobacter roseus]PZE18425.1 hypothetical protein DNU06_00910 [Putridiphycobacter roseus]
MKISYLVFLFISFNLFSSFANDENEIKVNHDSLIEIEKNNHKKIQLLLNKADDFLSHDYTVSALAMLDAQTLCKDSGDQEMLLKVNTRLAEIYTNYFADYFKAMEYSSSALLLSKDLDNSVVEMLMYQNISTVFEGLKDSKKAINYAENALNIANQLDLPNHQIALNSRLGKLYEKNNHPQIAIAYYGKVLEYENAPSFDSFVENYLSIAKYYVLVDSLKMAEVYYKKAVDKAIQFNKSKVLADTYAQFAELELLKGDVEDAIVFATKGLAISDSLSYMLQKIANHKVLNEIYKFQNKYQEAYEELNTYNILKDSIYNEKISHQIFLFEDDFKGLLVRSLKDKQLSQKLELKNEQLKRNILIGSLVLFVLFGFVMFSRLRVTTKLNNQLHKQKDELKRLSIVASDINNAVLILDVKLNVEWVNKGFENLTGYALKDVIGENPFLMQKGLLPNEEKIDYILQMFHLKEPFSADYQGLTKEGGYYWLDANITPYSNDDGVLEKFIVVATDITEKKEAELGLKTSYESARLLSEIGVAITAADNIEEIVDIVYGKIVSLMDASCFGVGLLDSEKQELNFINFIEKDRRFKNIVCDLDNDNLLGVVAVKQNKPLLIHDFEKEVSDYIEGEIQAVAGEIPKSVMYIPLLSKDKTIGVLTVQSFKANAYKDNHYNLAKNIANYMAIAIEKTVLYRNMESEVVKRTAEIIAQKNELLHTYANTKLLSEIGSDISSTLNFDDVFENVHSKISRLMDAEMFGVRLYNEAANEIEYSYEIESGELDPLGSIPIGEKINYTIWCIRNKKDIFIGNNKIEYINYIDDIVVLNGKSPNSLMFTPMIIDGQVIGVVTVQSMRINAFERHHLDLLKSLASYIGSALANGALYATLEHKVEARTIDLAEKNKNITDSINYARRIQAGILPSDNLINSLLPKSFVCFKPKDIVSGDFYWIAEKNGKVFVAVVDCTGHGVPGAFMSIIGESLLEQAINEPYINHTNEILDFMQEGLQKLFEQENASGSYNDLFDGMDMSICAINMHKKRLEYSGASNSLFKIKNDKVERYRGDKFGVSALVYGEKRNFSSQYIDFEAGDSFFILSDGIPDQFGGPSNKKFGYRRLGEILLEISSLNIENQKAVLETALEEWGDGIEQTDDICLLGFKI